MSVIRKIMAVRLEARMKGSVVKCWSCDRNVKVDEFGGLFTIKGKVGHFIIHNDKKCFKKLMLFKKVQESNIPERAKCPWEYKCGHKSTGLILDDNELSLAAYLVWKDSVGVDGDMSMCFNCYCDKTHTPFTGDKN